MRGQSQELDDGPEDDTQDRPVIPHIIFVRVYVCVSTLVHS